MADNSLKLYVWEDVLSSYTPGLMVALASSEKEAVQLLMQSVKQETNWMPRWIEHECDRKPPQVIDSPAAFFVTGGG